ncbi:TetR/AcrR family transcriptional regulator [Nonomuraea gerenzanensis]|uniref:Transcriptional regulator, TetR family n=1 Tax=Nonomuraea gerenzanensis TaxID=93944 RepID=A0A1M4DXB9_9ACTN|nr:TetR/AcrR family transcriptional regulator [Nonomuraea gerenzanensis]UBU13560.1 TetR/AcrR family transcriptional regulator [Nonomuraea gerenzanensis]SBO91225.1 Transcriptional regulator, TetR family [Nonomuraea gerenzanensis]
MGTRDVILDAAATVMAEQGLANVTTRQIARAAGFTEAALYKHFPSKADLMVAVMRERSPSFAPLVEALRGGGGDLVTALTAVARAAIGVYRAGFPMFASVFADPATLTAHKEELLQEGAGPHKANEALAAYLRAEQEAGRVRAGADVRAAAGLLLGACFQYAFLGHMSQAGFPDDEEAAASFVRTLLESLTPTPPPCPPPSA